MKQAGDRSPACSVPRRSLNSMSNPTLTAIEALVAGPVPHRDMPAIWAGGRVLLEVGDGVGQTGDFAVSIRPAVLGFAVGSVRGVTPPFLGEKLLSVSSESGNSGTGRFTRLFTSSADREWRAPVDSGLGHSPRDSPG